MLPILDAPPAGAVCPECGDPSPAFPDWCAVCHEAATEPCFKPHEGCGCARDASQGCHEGACEYDVVGHEGHVGCVKCADASAEAKRAACWLCDGTGSVEVERDESGDTVFQVCMACLGGTVTA